MPLPQSAIPAYQPRSFLVGQGVSAKGLELFFRYHPAIAKTKALELLVEDERYLALADAEKRKILSEEIKQIDGLIARYRSTGAGPSGIGAGTGAGGGGGARGSSRAGGGGLRAGSDLDFIADMSSNEIRRQEIATEAGAAALRAYDKLVEIPRPYAQFAAELLGNEDRSQKIARMKPAQLEEDIELAFLDAQERFGASAVSEDPLTRQVAATDFYYQLRARRPDLLPAIGGKALSAESVSIIEAIDRMYLTDNFLLKSFQSGREPQVALDAEKQIAASILLGRASPQAGVFEKRARQIMEGLPAEAVDTEAKRSEEQRKAMNQARAELGIVAPLDDAEAAMLSRYTEALSDDGKATREELGADYDAAKAAYDRGRRVERLPRGAEVYYDDTYLELLGRRASLSQQARAGQEREGTPIQRAARRAEGLPEVPREAYEAAAAVSPLAAESLPYAMRRFTKAGGKIEPESSVERNAQRIISADPAKRPAFVDFVAQVNKMYPDDADARREAFAYYGAYNQGRDLQTETFNPDVLAGKPPAPAAPPAVPDVGELDAQAADEQLRQTRMQMALAAQREAASQGAGAPLAQRPPLVDAAGAAGAGLSPGGMPPSSPLQPMPMQVDPSRSFSTRGLFEGELAGSGFEFGQMAARDPLATYPSLYGPAMGRSGVASQAARAAGMGGPTFGAPPPALAPVTEEDLVFGGGVLPTRDEELERMRQELVRQRAFQDLRGGMQ